MFSVHRPFVLTCTLAAVAALSACQKPPAADAATDAKAKPALLVAPEDVRSVGRSGLMGAPVVTGAVLPERRADLRAEVGAVVTAVAKDNGEKVRAGEVIVRLDATAIRDNLGAAEESLRVATQAAEQAERVVARARTLNQQGMTSTQALEDAEQRRNAAASELAASKARWVSARQQLTRTEVRAPFDGVVSERKVSVGDTVQVGREIVKVIDPRTLRFEGQVSADRQGELRVGQSVAFRVNGWGDKAFAGTLARVDAAANATTRQVEVIVRFKDLPQGALLSGLYAEGRVDTGTRETLVLPEGSIQREGDSAFVWKLDGALLRRQAVELGPRDERRGEVAIAAGLQLGQEVLRAPGSGLVDGQPVTRVAAGAGAASAVRAASGPAR